MLIVGEDSKKTIDSFSSTFKSDFLGLLKASHGEKKISANHFYQEYIANKEHVHMNATKWISLSEFVKAMGREGLVRVEEGEKGFFISYVDNSPDALKRQEFLRKKEKMDRGDEEREQKAIREQVERAKREAERAGKGGEDEDEEARALKREDGGRIKLAFGPAAATTTTTTTNPETKSISPPTTTTTPIPIPSTTISAPSTTAIKINPLNPKKKNVFASSSKKKTTTTSTTASTTKPISEAERIMKEELERKRIRSSGSNGANGNSGFNSKRQRVA